MRSPGLHAPKFVWEILGGSIGLPVRRARMGGSEEVKEQGPINLGLTLCRPDLLAVFHYGFPGSVTALHTRKGTARQWQFAMSAATVSVRAKALLPWPF